MPAKTTKRSATTKKTKKPARKIRRRTFIKSHWKPALFAVSFAAVGSFLLIRTFAATTEYTLLGNQKPVVVDYGASKPVELGMRFSSSVAGTVKGVRFYKSAGNTGVHTGTLWSNGGTRKYATVTFTNETSSGWQKALFSNPVSINAGQKYIISYHTTKGHYSFTRDYFKDDITKGPLTALENTTTRGNGVFRFGSSAFPANSAKGINYLVDVVFSPTTTPPATCPSGQTGTPPNCVTVPATCPSGQTGTPPNCTPLPTSAVPCQLTSAAESCWAANTGPTNPAGGRYTEAQITAGQSNLKKVTSQATAPAGTTYSNGGLSVNTAGTVVDRIWIDGCIAVNAKNVTIKNSLVRTSSGCSGGNGSGAYNAVSSGGSGTTTGLLIQDTEVNGMNATYDYTALGTRDYTCVRCNVHGGVKNVWAGSNVVIKDSYIHNPSTGGGNIHGEAIMADSGNDITIDHSWVSAKDAPTMTGAVQFLASWGPGNDLTINNSFLQGGVGADFATDAGAYNVVITNNAFSNLNGWGGTTFVYGYNPNNPGNVWTGNYVPETGKNLRYNGTQY